MPLGSVSCLQALARNPRILLNNIGNSKNPFLVPDINGNASGAFLACFIPLRL